MIRVALVDDQALVRAGFASLLEDEEDIDVVGEAGDGEAGLRLAQRERPDVILMDVRMPEMDGIEATRRIGVDPALRQARVIILTTFELDEYVFQGLRAGAAGFLLKDTDAAELLRAVRVVAAGDALLSPAVTRRLVAEFASSTRPARHFPGTELLTPREREVVALVGEGLSNDDIGLRLFMSPSTAKTHVNRAMSKLGVRDRAQLVIFAYESRLVQPGF